MIEAPSMNTKAEGGVSRALSSLLEGLANGASLDQESEHFRTLCTALEFFLPSVLGQVYDFWRGDSLDGFRFVVARKVGPRSVEMLGLGLLISDQCWTPLQLLIRLAPSNTKVEALTCRIGERVLDKGGLVRLPVLSSGVDKFALRLVGRDVDWAFEADFDEGRSA
jgi:hypothetical protein